MYPGNVEAWPVREQGSAGSRTERPFGPPPFAVRAASFAGRRTGFARAARVFAVIEFPDAIANGNLGAETAARAPAMTRARPATATTRHARRLSLETRGSALKDSSWRAPSIAPRGCS